MPSRRTPLVIEVFRRQQQRDPVRPRYLGDGKRFVVHADEKLTAALELESAMRRCGESSQARNAQYLPIDA